MNAEFGTNWIPLVVLLPLTLIIAIGIGWLVVKLKIEKWKKITLGVAGLFAVFGFAVAVITVYYQVSPSFAYTFKFYTHTVFALGEDPFETTDNPAEAVIMQMDVWTGDKAGELVEIPTPDGELVTYLFVPGKFIEAHLKDEKLTIPEKEEGDLPAVTETSLWWALSKNIQKVHYQIIPGKDYTE